MGASVEVRVDLVDRARIVALTADDDPAPDPTLSRSSSTSGKLARPMNVGWATTLQRIASLGSPPDSNCSPNYPRICGTLPATSEETPSKTPRTEHDESPMVHRHPLPIRIDAQLKEMETGGSITTTRT